MGQTRCYEFELCLRHLSEELMEPFGLVWSLEEATREKVHVSVLQ